MVACETEASLMREDESRKPGQRNQVLLQSRLQGDWERRMTEEQKSKKFDEDWCRRLLLFFTWPRLPWHLQLPQLLHNHQDCPQLMASTLIKFTDHPLILYKIASIWGNLERLILAQAVSKHGQGDWNQISDVVKYARPQRAFQFSLISFSS